MKKVVLYAVTASICINACNKGDVPKDVKLDEPIVLTSKLDERVSANNRFALQMFNEVSKQEGLNTFFSSLGLNMALGMLYNGASGETRTEMAEVLGMADFTDSEINEHYQKMSQSMLDFDPLTNISIANSIWYRQGFYVKQSFIDVNRKYFDAEVNSLDFNIPDAADTINKWCADKTNDRIPKIIDDISADVRMYLINALYFKSKWQFPFTKVPTKQEDFTKADKQRIKINMMTQATTLPYYIDKYLAAVEMPYGNQAFSMVAVLPADNMDIDQLIEHLDNTAWQNIVNKLRQQYVWLKLPRFKIESEITLNEPVKNVGMKRIFSGGFENISDALLLVSAIKQKTFVGVNEEGTEAAAVTWVEMETSSGGGTDMPVQFFANRPFLYLIKERSTGAILFIGRMDEPQE
jgi:serpin B